MERKEIKTEIVINASPEKVWHIFSSFEEYPKWNPFIKSLKGPFQPGKKITVRLEPPDGTAMTIKPKVLVYEPERGLRWKGHLLVPGLFDGEHIFELSDNKDGTTTFIHREKFNGILVPLFKNMLDNAVLRGFKAMNEKLKEVVEG